jgi:nicotinate-nucleotide adenylyltransferase
MHLRSKFPQHEFILIIGGDNLAQFTKWKNYNNILQHHAVYVYARNSIVETPQLIQHANIRLLEVPLLNISSTYIRESVKNRKSIKYLVPKEVEQMIAANGFYSE